MRRFLLVLLILLVLGTAAWFAAAFYLPFQGFSGEGVYVVVPRGASQRAIAYLLADNGVIRSPIVFEAISRNHSRRTLQAGEYFFDHAQTPSQVFWQIAEGRVATISVTIPEGLTIFEAADLFGKTGLATRSSFLEAARDPSSIRDLAPGARTLEGYLFPSTYQFPRHVSAPDIAATMVRRFREVWSTLPAASDPRSVQSVVTLASLVERETPVPDERPLVAGVFANRLRLNIALQCDPTVAYALEMEGRYTGRLDARDLSIDSSYNTYRHPGLPPGPIASPGERSLRAALTPAETDYLYFVANTQGGHFFASTLAEHNRNVSRYHQLLGRPDPPAKKASGKKPSAKGKNGAR